MRHRVNLGIGAMVLWDCTFRPKFAWCSALKGFWMRKNTSQGNSRSRIHLECVQHIGTLIRAYTLTYCESRILDY